MERSLNEIALSTGTDKSDRRHGYTWVYESYLEAVRQEPITLLEIGVWEGQSLRMWREYFPNARIYGLDRDPRCGALALPGVEVLLGDQSNPESLREAVRRVGPLDVVIDDGSHIGEHQIESFETLFPVLKPGGVYVIEDLHTSYWGWGERSAILYFKALVDAVMAHGRSRWAEIRNDPNYPRLQAQLGYFEQHLVSVQFHRCIIFIRKRLGGEPEVVGEGARGEHPTPNTQHPTPDTELGSEEGVRFQVVIPSGCAANLVPCVQALLRNEPALQAEDVIVVDDGARQDAESLRPGVRWVAGTKPFVFARNVNRGIREAEGDVVLLNDDARLVTPGGLTRMARELRRHSGVGLCSPGVQGVIANPNQVASGRGEWREEPRMLAFVCVYIPRSVYAEVGPLDERFTGYGFDDNDYCARTVAAGLRLAVWDGCVIDHAGGLPSSFRTRPDIQALFEENRARFESKWGQHR